MPELTEPVEVDDGQPFIHHPGEFFQYQGQRGPTPSRFFEEFRRGEPGASPS
jgi:hypothetical protein